MRDHDGQNKVFIVAFYESALLIKVMAVVAIVARMLPGMRGGKGSAEIM